MKAGNDTGSFRCTGAVKDTYDRQLFVTCLIVSAQITTGSAEYICFMGGFVPSIRSTKVHYSDLKSRANPV
jgi:hypothetical protein